MFSRYIKEDWGESKYIRTKETEDPAALLNNCHWGGLKLFYSEMEFLNLVVKHVPLNELLIVYIGAATGERLKYLFKNIFFKDITMLLYDLKDFKIKSGDGIIVKSGMKDGWFDDDKVDEIKKIANGRKIAYISDIRLDISTKDNLDRELVIYEDLRRQQRWGCKMDADFMLLKFRLFFYNKSIDEIQFINNNDIENEIKDYVVFDKDPVKHEDKTNNFLYLNGKIYTQIYAGKRSTETRLYVKKIKYYKDRDKYSKNDWDKFPAIYHNVYKYESILNNYNMNIRKNEMIYKESNRLADILPGFNNDYTCCTEYCIIEQYINNVLKNNNPTFEDILYHLLTIYLFMQNNYTNNLIRCSIHNTNATFLKYGNKSFSETNIKAIANYTKELIKLSRKKIIKLNEFKKNANKKLSELISKFIISLKIDSIEFEVNNNMKKFLTKKPNAED